ncbi:MAG TPA: hypothetical protein VGL61_15515 [Kofleriaceae bacterium]|jgi:uncharacterized protein (TIGR00290 family)
MARPRAIVSWSTGKDSAFALHVARAAGELDLVGLVTTVTTAFGRVSMHGVREELLARQVAATGLPCRTVGIPSPCSNEHYERELGDVLVAARDDGVTHVVFGDLFLADIRAYREALLGKLGLQCVFPLWHRDTHALAREMIDAGMHARLTCVDPKQLDARFAGREYDADLLAELPATVDPCGERGEFHTFVTAGPMFREPIAVRAGEVVIRDGFAFADLL